MAIDRETLLFNPVAAELKSAEVAAHEDITQKRTRVEDVGCVTRRA